jgi:hypothetical protein
MIDEKLLKRINEKVELRTRIKHVLRGFESPYVETTVGLLCVNGASKNTTSSSDDANWLHNGLPKIEGELKERAAALLNKEISEIDAWLSERIVE